MRGSARLAYLPLPGPSLRPQQRQAYSGREILGMAPRRASAISGSRSTAPCGLPSKKNFRHGQIFSLEIMMTFSFFLAAVLIFMASWNSISASYAREAKLRGMQTSLLGISDMFVMSQGDPRNWEIGSMENSSAFGLASYRGVLSPQKLAALQSLNASYAQVKESMGAGQADIYIAVYNANGGMLYSFGLPVGTLQAGTITAGIQRLAMLDGSLVKVNIQLWRADNN